MTVVNENRDRLEASPWSTDNTRFYIVENTYLLHSKGRGVAQAGTN